MVCIGHLYADDSQAYDFCRPNSTDVQHLRSVSKSCISDIADWMKCNRLQLNSSKSEFIWCSSSRRLKYLDCNPFVIGADAVQPKNEVRDLGLVLDRDLTMTSHITGLVRTSFAILGQLRSVSHPGRASSSGTKFDLEPNRLLQCRLCRLATTQHSFGSRQSSTLLLVWFCESNSLTTSQP